MFPEQYFALLAASCAFWAEVLCPKDAEVVTLKPQPNRHIHVGPSVVVAFR